MKGGEDMKVETIEITTSIFLSDKERTMLLAALELALMSECQKDVRSFVQELYKELDIH